MEVGSSARSRPTALSVSVASAPSEASGVAHTRRPSASGNVPGSPPSTFSNRSRSRSLSNLAAVMGASTLLRHLFPSSVPPPLPFAPLFVPFPPHTLGLLRPKNAPSFFTLPHPSAPPFSFLPLLHPSPPPPLSTLIPHLTPHLSPSSFIPHSSSLSLIQLPHQFPNCFSLIPPTPPSVSFIPLPIPFPSSLSPIPLHRPGVEQSVRSPSRTDSVLVLASGLRKGLSSPPRKESDGSEAGDSSSGDSNGSDASGGDASGGDTEGGDSIESAADNGGQETDGGDKEGGNEKEEDVLKGATEASYTAASSSSSSTGSSSDSSSSSSDSSSSSSEPSSASTSFPTSSPSSASSPAATSAPADSSAPPAVPAPVPAAPAAPLCDLYHGRWVRTRQRALYSGERCGWISTNWACARSNRPREMRGYERLRWQPRGCNVKRFNAEGFFRSPLFSLPRFYPFPCPDFTPFPAPISPLSLPRFHPFPCPDFTPFPAPISPLSLPRFHPFPCPDFTPFPAPISPFPCPDFTPFLAPISTPCTFRMRNKRIAFDAQQEHCLCGGLAGPAAVPVAALPALPKRPA
ncbi:unnamed protein product [Closterium sp. Naga37s-1]|nr:unnamed protein product [Closterium sp. Naga37s-1]